MLAYFKRVTIRLSQSNKKKKTKSKSNKYSTWTLSVFLAFSILAIGNLLNSATEGFKNFGQFQDVLAAIGVAPNRDEIAAGSGSESLIIDAYDRCLVVDPNLADDDNPSGQTVPLYRYAGLSSIEVYGENIGGINVGNTIDGGPNTALLDKTVELGMSFSIGIITQPGSVEGAVSFIEESNARDLVPIVRLCYPGGCGFDMNGNPGSVTDFFRQVEAQADGNFIAMIGPNEAGTSGEMESFDYALGDYEELVRDMMAIATDLQSIGSEKMLIAPGAFNLTNTQQNDARNILTSSSFDPSKVNVLLFNAYDLPSGDAYSFYSTDSVFNLQAYASQNNLPVIMTEFGTFSGNYDQLKLSAQRLCADPNFAGILGFRSFTSLGRDLQPNPRPGPTFSDEQWANEILANCDPKDLFSANGGTTTADYAWLSCNLDSCIYEKEFDERSVAKAVSSVAEIENSEEMEYALKIKCGRNVPNLPDCITERQLTAQVLMPIRQFGSNNPKGEDFYGYPSYCAELASYFESNNATIDPLNQFAGILESENGGNYPMPWLGSAINCSAELAKGTSEFAGVSDLDYEPNPGSLISNTYEDIFYDFINGVGRPGSPAIDFSGLLNDDQLAQLGNRNANDLQNMIADERAICGINGDPEQCLDITSNANFVSSLRPYVPVDVPINYKRPEGQNSSNMIIRDEDYNYIHGPEVLLGEKELVYEEYSDVLCREYAQRNTGAANPGLKFEDDTNCGVRPLPGEENNPSFIGATVEARNVSACSTLRSFCSLDQIANGQCDTNSLGGNIYAGCFTLGPKGMNAWSTIKENQSLEERDIPEYQIPGIYDSLFYSNQRLQTIMSQRNLKIVFFENVGWEIKTKLKVRDAGREFEGDLSANYSQQISNEFASCQAPQEIFNNEYYLARGEAEIERSQYYDWLGVLDIMQEYITVYSRDGVNTAENAYVNPIFNEEDSSDDELSRLIEEFNLEAGDLSPGLRKQALLSSGSASLATRFPIPTCDDIEIAKLRAAQTDTEDDDYLIGKYFTCITFANDSTYDNVSDSTETLNDFLCKKGYQVKGVCEDAVCRVDDIARDNYSGAKVEQIDGGVKATIDNPESIVTREYSSTVRVDQFIEETDTQLATNGPFMLNAFGGAKAEGLVKAHNGELKFVDTYRGMTHAIVKHDGTLQKNITNNSDYANYSYNLVAGDKYSQPTIVAANEDYAIIYIFEMARCREDLKSQIEAEGRNLNACPSRLYTRADVDNILGILNGHVDFAISGAALITVDGNEASTSVFNDSEAAARTIIGWDTSDELVLGVLDAANLTGMKNYANSNNLETALLLDGGGSTQMYYEPGFSTVISGYQPNPDIADDMNKDQVYWPGRPGESGPRTRDYFIGVKLDEAALDTSNDAGDNVSNFNIDPTNGVGNLTLTYGGGFTTTDGTTFTGHNGLDYAAPEGTVITAAADGKVVLIGSDEDGYGEYVIIEHTLFNGNKIYTLYAHMSEVLVLKDQEVNYGQEIGLMGTTGNSTGTHLHFEVRRGDGPVDPVICADGYDDNPGAGIDLGDCTFDPQGEELQEVLAGGLDGGSQEICSSLDNPNVRNFDSLDCLIASVSSYISQEYSESLGTEFVHSSSLLKATLIRESSARIKAADGTRSDYTGDPLERSHYTDVDGNDISLSSDAVGPMQFIGPTFGDLISRNGEVFVGCLEFLGIDANAITPEIRTYIGPALCMAAIKQVTDVRGVIGDRITELNSAESWEEQKFGSDSGQFYEDDNIDYEMSAVHISARKYFGRCTFDFGGGATGDYCAQVYDLTRTTQVQCTSNSSPTL
jgi:murein DD-endopeptidase MepM/ murein hydrolase activator NlpD